MSTLDPEFLAMMPYTVTIEPWVSFDAWGAAIYGAAVTYTARIEHRRKQVLNVAGEMVTSMQTVFLATETDIDPASRLTLPAGWSPSQPPIIQTARLTDESGLYGCTVLYC